MDMIIHSQSCRSKTPIKSLTNHMRIVYRNPILPQMALVEFKEHSNSKQMNSVERKAIEGKKSSRNTQSMTTIRRRPRQIDLSSVINTQATEETSTRISMNLSKSRIPSTDRQPLNLINRPVTNRDSQEKVQVSQFVGVWNNQRKLKDMFKNDKKISKMLTLEDSDQQKNDKRYFKNFTEKRSLHYRSILYKAEALKRGRSPLLQSINYSTEYSKPSIKLNMDSQHLLHMTVTQLKQSEHLSSKIKNLILQSETLKSGQGVVLHFYQQLHVAIQFMLYDTKAENKTETQIMQAYFYKQQITHQELFLIKNSICQALLDVKYTVQQVNQVFCQMEQFRYYLQKPGDFIIRIFDQAFYNEFVMNVFSKLIKNQSYLKNLQLQSSQQKTPQDQQPNILQSLMRRLQQGLLPFLIGNYRMPFQQTELKLYDFKYTILLEIMNIQLLHVIEKALIDYELDIWITNDIVRRIRAFLNILPNRRYELSPNINNYEFYQSLLYNWNMSTPNLQMVSSYDIWTIVCLQNTKFLNVEDDSDGEFENIQLITSFKSFEVLMNHYLD